MNNKMTKLAIIILAITGLQACDNTALTVELPGLGGSVTSADGSINCPEMTCVFDYKDLIQAGGGATAQITLTAEASDGYKFSRYEFAEAHCVNGVEANQTAKCVVKMEGPRVVKAIFEADLCPNDPQDNCLNNPEGDYDSDGLLNVDDPCPNTIGNHCVMQAQYMESKSIAAL